MSVSPNESSNDENFLSRWSRRKKQVESESSFKDEGLSADIASEKSVDTEKSPEEIQEEKLAKLARLNALTDEDMPEVETLGEDSEYAGFMSVNVSEGLRKLALQKLFHGKSYNFRDGLDEYDEDFTSFEKLDPSVITADMRHAMEVEAEKLLAKAEDSEHEELETVSENMPEGDIEGGEGDGDSTLALIEEKESVQTLDSDELEINHDVGQSLVKDTDKDIA